MPSEDAAAGAEDFRPEQRLHPSSWLFGTLHILKSLLVPLTAAALFGTSRDYSAWMPVVMIVPLIAAGIWQQWIYRYGFSAHGLVIREGLIFRNVRTIDYARIENVDTERGLLHRVLGVAEVRVETSTGGSAEARIRVLGLDAVEDVRRRIFDRRGAAGTAAGDAPAPAAAGTETLLALPPSELVRYGLIDNRGLIVVGGILGVLAQSGFFENLGERFGPAVGTLPWDDVAAFGLAVQVLLGLTLAAVLIASTRVLSIMLAFAMLFGFTLTRSGADLNTRYGLFTRISMTLRRRRIQAVHQTATLLHRLFDRVSVKVDLAGGLTAGGDGQQQGARQHFRDLWLAPLVATADAERLIRAALPQVRLEQLDWRRLAPRARGRIFRILTLSWLVVASGPAAWWAGWWAVALLITPLPLFWLHATLYVKHTGWALHDEFFALRRGWLTRRLSLAPRDRIQSVHLRESPFDRRYGMIQLDVDLAGVGAATHRFTLPYLDRGDAAALAADLVGSRQTQ